MRGKRGASGAEQNSERAIGSISDGEIQMTIMMKSIDDHRGMSGVPIDELSRSDIRLAIMVEIPSGENPHFRRRDSDLLQPPLAN